MTGEPAGAPAAARRLGAVAPSAIGAVLRLGDRSDVISLAGGLPAPETFPDAAAARDAFADALDGPTALQYGDTNGLPALREWLVAHLRTRFGLSPAVDRVLVTHGSQQGIDLVCKVLLDPGDVVVVDRPSYLGALQVFRLFEADVVDVPMAADPDLAVLAGRLAGGLRPKLLYVVPTHANPTGATLSADQRRRLAGLADRYGFVVLEDDPYGDVGFDGEPAGPALAALTTLAVRLDSLSKVLFPSSRVGFLVAPPWLADRLTLVRQAGDLGNSLLLQEAALRLLLRGDGDARLTAARELYRDRCGALVGALATAFGAAADLTAPGGGFFLWVRFAGVDTTELLRASLVEGVSFVPGAPFYAGDPDTTTARLSFAALPSALAPVAAGRLGAAYRAVAAGEPAQDVLPA